MDLVDDKVEVIAHTTDVDQLNEWVVEVDGIRRARYIGHHAAYYAAREANRWRRELDSLTKQS